MSRSRVNRQTINQNSIKLSVIKFVTCCVIASGFLTMLVKTDFARNIIFISSSKSVMSDVNKRKSCVKVNYRSGCIDDSHERRNRFSEWVVNETFESFSLNHKCLLWCGSPDTVCKVNYGKLLRKWKNVHEMMLCVSLSVSFVA